MTTQDAKTVSAEGQTDETSVSAEEEQIAQAVADAVDVTEPAEQQEEQQEAPAPLTASDLENSIKRLESSLQGRTANWTAEQFRQFRVEMRKELDAQFAPMREQAALIEQAHVEQMEPEDQAEYWRKRALEPNKPAETVAQQVEPAYSDTDVSRLRGRVEGMLAGIGLDLDPQDERLWVGARIGTSIDDLFSVAQRNAKGLVQPATPAEPSAPARPRIPTTNGARKTQGRQYNSWTDITEALIAGEINSDESRELRRNLG